MLNSLRNFTKSFWAKILLVIIIIPFVFWGMGGVFGGGSQNTVAKINNYNISTKNFEEYINALNINTEVIRENIDNSIIEQLLSQLINKTSLSLQSKDLDIALSDNILSEIIKKDEKFFDKNNQFSRVKYEKFLISNNFSATLYEKNLKNSKVTTRPWFAAPHYVTFMLICLSKMLDFGFLAPLICPTVSHFAIGSIKSAVLSC